MHQLVNGKVSEIKIITNVVNYLFQEFLEIVTRKN